MVNQIDYRALFMSDNHPRIIISVEVGEPVRVLDINNVAREFLNVETNKDLTEITGLLSSSLIEDIRKLPGEYNKPFSLFF